MTELAWPRLTDDITLVAWLVAGALAAAILGYVVYAFIGTFVFGVFLYYATRPVYRRVEPRIRPPSLAVGVSLFLLVLPVLLLLGALVLLGIEEALRAMRQNQFQVLSIETQLSIYAQPYLEVIRSPGEVLSSPELIGNTQETLSRIRPFLGTIANALLHLFIVFGLAFYLLRDDQRLSAWTRERFTDRHGVIESFCGVVDRDLNQIFFGNVLNAEIQVDRQGNVAFVILIITLEKDGNEVKRQLPVNLPSGTMATA